MTPVIFAIMLFILFIVWVVAKNIERNINADLKSLIKASLPFILRIPAQTFLILLAKVLNREDIIEKFYEDRLLILCKLLINSSVFKSDDDVFNKRLLSDIYKISTIEIILFYNLRGRVIDKALPIGVRKINWHFKVN